MWWRNESYDRKKAWSSRKHRLKDKVFAIDQYLPKSRTDLDNRHTYGMLPLLVLLKKKIKTYLSAPFQPPERRDMDVINFMLKRVTIFSLLALLFFKTSLSAILISGIGQCS